MPIPTNIEMGGSSDVGDVSWNVPTMGAVYASWPRHIPPHQWGCVATNGMSIGRKAVVQAAHVLAATGLDLLTEPDLLKAVRDEFDKRTAGKPYSRDFPFGLTGNRSKPKTHPILTSRPPVSSSR